ncbi:MAG: DUF6311 domain-containing protein [Pseudomonadota bacterium]
MTNRRRSSAAIGLASAGLIGLLAGLFAFLLGPGVSSLLDPPASATAPVGDTAMALSGAYAFIADDWRWPLFDFEGLAETHSTNAIFTDSIPLYTLVWKLLFSSAPKHFALFLPIWVLVLFAWQGVAAGLSLRLLGVGQGAAILAGALLVALWPAFLHRIPLHPALAAHGFVVLAIAMMLSPPLTPSSVRARLIGWSALLTGAALIHGYLFAMAAIAYAVQGCALLIRPPDAVSRGRLALAGLVPIVAVATLMAGAGYFGGVPTEAGGFGHFRLNLAAPFLHGGDSVLPEWLKIPVGQASGYTYVPVASLGVMALSIVLWATKRGHAPRLADQPAGALVLGLAALGILLFATTGQLSWGQKTWLTIPLPVMVIGLGEVLRGSGRFVWLLSYAVLLLAIARVAVGLRKPWAVLVLGTAAGLVALEMTPLRARTFPEPGEFSADPILAETIAQAERIAVLPPWGCDPLHYPGLDKEIQVHAALAGARMANSLAAARIARRCKGSLPDGFLPNPEPGALLVVKRGGAGLGPISRAGIDPASCATHRGLALCSSPRPAGLGAMPSAPLPMPHKAIFSDLRTADAHLGQGFGAPEPWGAWTIADQAELPLALGAGAARLKLRLRGFVPQVRPKTGGTVVLETRSSDSEPWREVDRRRVAFVRGQGQRVVEFSLPTETPSLVRLLLRPDAPIRPSDLGSGADHRRLGLGVISVKID